MKIGFSLGRCVRDIVKGEVKTDDVVVIVAQTYCRNVGDLLKVIEHYLERSNYLKGLDPITCRGVALVLWSDAKIHQPRVIGDDPLRSIIIPDNAIWKELV